MAVETNWSCGRHVVMAGTQAGMLLGPKTCAWTRTKDGLTTGSGGSVAVGETKELLRNRSRLIVFDLLDQTSLRQIYRTG